MFIDEVKVHARAGHGGKGCVAFRREAFRPKGGPSGGNGGRGGTVILRADHDLNNLVNQLYQSRLFAEKGHHGMGKEMDGRAGKDLIVKVPVGTLVWALPEAPKPLVETIASDEEEEEAENPLLLSSSGSNQIIRHSGASLAQEVDLAEPEPVFELPPIECEAVLVADLTEHGQEFVLSKGGRGGLGNRNFATSVRQAPRFAQPGEPGGEGRFRLELRILADVGLAGYPNAGKSTLLSAISKAHPKIAPYPFTTLHPQIGIVDYDDYHRLTVCDIPGIIEGAHENVGLGHAFLRHILRCRVLVILLDMAGTDGRKPWDDYRKLLRELEYYHPSLVDKPRLVVANKMDETVAEANLKDFKKRIRKTKVLQISAAFDGGIDAFKQAIREAVAAVE